MVDREIRAKILSPYRMIRRDNIATRLFPSDFALVEIDDPLVVSALRSSDRVKYVVRQRQFVVMEDDDNIDDDNDNGNEQEEKLQKEVSSDERIDTLLRKKLTKENDNVGKNHRHNEKRFLFRRLSVDDEHIIEEEYDVVEDNQMPEEEEVVVVEYDDGEDKDIESKMDMNDHVRPDGGRHSTRWFVKHQNPNAAQTHTSMQWQENTTSIWPASSRSIPNTLVRADPYNDINPFFVLFGSGRPMRSFNGTDTSATLNAGARKLLLNEEITEKLHANVLWRQGYKGRNVRVAVFDTGLRTNHLAFAHVEERINFSSEQTADDSLGHGTFVAGVIASQGGECRGFAPESKLHIFKVFTSQQISYTSWFLDAFNYALLSGINILNLSIGGPDYLDTPFVDKVWELSANNVIIVSAIGNDGPLYGTLNNPADQADVVGVGGISDDDDGNGGGIASFSSRGATTGEFSHGGYGRAKPDIVTYGSKVRGTGRYGNCNTLSGTSVACPVITGALALLASTVPEEKRWTVLNPASVKQILHESSQRVPDANLFEQGMGKFDLIRAHEILQRYQPKATFFPPHLDLTDCPYMWPHCAQPTYHSAIPIIFNITVFNGIGVTGKFSDGYPRWIPKSNGHVLDVHFSPSETLWPWSGFLGVSIAVNPAGRFFEGVAEGTIEAKIISPPDQRESIVQMNVKIPVIRPPLKQYRLLWDQYHNMQYPPGYIPRDNLNRKDDILDWNGDHPHTNFKDMFNFLRSKGYFIEVLQEDLTQFDARRYGTLLLVDTEDEFTEEERRKLKHDVDKFGLSLLVLAEWYNVDIMQKIKFFDDNTHELWTPLIGGSNVPALNALLEPYGIMLGTDVYNGEISVGDQKAVYASGTSIVRFPEGGRIATFQLEDQTKEFLSGSTEPVLRDDTPVLGFLQTSGKGRIVVYGDTTCFDNVQANVPKCFGLLEDMLEFTSRRRLTDQMESILRSPLREEYLDLNAQYAERSADVQSSFFKHSKISHSQCISAHRLSFMANVTRDLVPPEAKGSPDATLSYAYLVFPVVVTLAVVLVLTVLLVRKCTSSRPTSLTSLDRKTSV